MDERFKPQPHIAQSWERSEDSRIWTFHIRPGVKFHDGVELTAEDVAFTFRKVKEPEIGRRFWYIFKEVERIIVKDKYTLQITLKRPLAPFLQTLEGIGMLPKHLLEGEDFFTTPFNDQPIGSGSFRVKSWSKDEALLEANSAYFLGRPYLNRIFVKVHQEKEAIWPSLISGEADLFYSPTPERNEFLKQIPSFRIYSGLKPYYYIIGFNLKNKLFMDQRVRQALNYAVNKEEIVAKALNGEGQGAAGPILPGSWAYNPNVKPYPYDPQKAQALLKEAGWNDHDGDLFLDRNGIPFEFTVYVNIGDDLKEKVSLMIQEQLLAIGIKVKLMFFDASDIAFLIRGDFQSFFAEVRALGDPDIGYIFWHSSQIDGGYNVCSYKNPHVDSLLDMGRAEFDLEKRKPIYFQFQEEIQQDPPAIFLFWTTAFVGIHERFQGVNINFSKPFFSNVIEWYVPKSKQR